VTAASFRGTNLIVRATKRNKFKARRPLRYNRSHECMGAHTPRELMWMVYETGSRLDPIKLWMTQNKHAKGVQDGGWLRYRPAGRLCQSSIYNCNSEVSADHGGLRLH
jgi:hypothetical protein